MMSQSELTGKWYQDEDVVFFRNLYQCAFYVKNNCLPIDMFCDSKGKLVMVFDRQRHNELIKLWIANKDICDKEDK